MGPELCFLTTITDAETTGLAVVPIAVVPIIAVLLLELCSDDLRTYGECARTRTVTSTTRPTNEFITRVCRSRQCHGSPPASVSGQVPDLEVAVIVQAIPSPEIKTLPFPLTLSTFVNSYSVPGGLSSGGGLLLKLGSDDLGTIHGDRARRCSTATITRPTECMARRRRGSQGYGTMVDHPRAATRRVTSRDRTGVPVPCNRTIAASAALYRQLILFQLEGRSKRFRGIVNKQHIIQFTRLRISA